MVCRLLVILTYPRNILLHSTVLIFPGPPCGARGVDTRPTLWRTVGYPAPPRLSLTPSGGTSCRDRVWQVCHSYDSWRSNIGFYFHVPPSHEGSRVIDGQPSTPCKDGSLVSLETTFSPLIVLVEHVRPCLPPHTHLTPFQSVPWKPSIVRML